MNNQQIMDNEIYNASTPPHHALDGNIHHSYYAFSSSMSSCHHQLQQGANSYHFSYSHPRPLRHSFSLPNHTYPHSMPVPKKMQKNAKLPPRQRHNSATTNTNTTTNTKTKTHATTNTDNHSATHTTTNRHYEPDKTEKNKTPPPPPPPRSTSSQLPHCMKQTRKSNNTRTSVHSHKSHVRKSKAKRKSEADKLHPIEIEYEYDTDENNEGGLTHDSQHYHVIHKNKKKKPETHNYSTQREQRKRKQKQMVIVIDNPEQCNSDNPINQYKNSDTDTLPQDLLLENMIQIQQEMFSHFEKIHDGNATNPYHTMESVKNAKDANKEQKHESMDMMNKMHSLISPRSDDTCSVSMCLNTPNHTLYNKSIISSVHALSACDVSEHDRMASFASSMNHHLEHYHEEEQLELELELDLDPIVEEKHNYNKSIAISEMSRYTHENSESEVNLHVDNIDFTMISPRVVMRKKQIERNRMQYKHIKSRSKSLSDIGDEIGVSVAVPVRNDSVIFHRANTYSNHGPSGSRRERRHKRKHKYENTEIRRIKSADYHKKRRRKSSKHKEREQGKHKKHRRTSVKISELKYSQTSPINTFAFDVEFNLKELYKKKKKEKREKKKKEKKSRKKEKSARRKEKKHKRHKKSKHKKHKKEKERKKREKKERKSKHKKDKKKRDKKRKSKNAKVSMDKNTKSKIEKLQIDLNAEYFEIRAHEIEEKKAQKQNRRKNSKKHKHKKRKKLYETDVFYANKQRKSLPSLPSTTDNNNVILPMSPPISLHAIPPKARLSISPQTKLFFGSNNYSNYNKTRFVPPSNQKHNHFIPIPPPPKKLSNKIDVI